MNARVFLLVLVTAAFMAIWDADRPTELRQVVAGSNGTAATASLSNVRAKVPAADVATDSVSQKDADLSLISANDEKLIPLPKGLASGTWHVFNHEGDSVHITIERDSGPHHSPDSNATPPIETSANSCIVTGSDGVRWCFVKEENAAAN